MSKKKIKPEDAKRIKEMEKFFEGYSPFQVLEAYTCYISSQIYKVEEERNLGEGIWQYTFDELQILLDELVDIEIHTKEKETHKLEFNRAAIVFNSIESKSSIFGSEILKEMKITIRPPRLKPEDYIVSLEYDSQIINHWDQGVDKAIAGALHKMADFIVKKSI